MKLCRSLKVLAVKIIYTNLTQILTIDFLHTKTYIQIAKSSKQIIDNALTR